MLCPSLMLEPTYLPYFCGMKKEPHMFHLGLSLIEIIKKMIIVTIQVKLYDGDKNRA